MPAEEQPLASELSSQYQTQTTTPVESCQENTTNKELEIDTEGSQRMETDETLPETPKRSAQEKHRALRGAIELLRTVNFNETRKGLNAELKGLKRTEKHKLFRTLASNLPAAWCEKFE